MSFHVLLHEPATPKDFSAGGTWKLQLLFVSVEVIHQTPVGPERSLTLRAGMGLGSHVNSVVQFVCVRRRKCLFTFWTHKDFPSVTLSFLFVILPPVCGKLRQSWESRSAHGAHHRGQEITVKVVSLTQGTFLHSVFFTFFLLSFYVLRTFFLGKFFIFRTLTVGVLCLNFSFRFSIIKTMTPHRICLICRFFKLLLYFFLFFICGFCVNPFAKTANHPPISVIELQVFWFLETVHIFYVTLYISFPFIVPVVSMFGGAICCLLTCSIHICFNSLGFLPYFSITNEIVSFYANTPNFLLICLTCIS